MKALFNNGVWAIFSSLDQRVLQFKPGILVDKELCDEILNRLDTALVQARASAFSSGSANRRTTTDKQVQREELADAA